MVLQQLLDLHRAQLDGSELDVDHLVAIPLPLPRLNHRGVVVGVRDAGFFAIDTTRPQFWSITQFFSADFSLSRIDSKKCVFNKCTTKVASAVLGVVLGPPHLAQHTCR